MTELISKKKILPSGPIGADILCVGEAPGYEEDKAGIPFSGESGELFNNLLGYAGLSRANVRVTNICNYRPNNNKFDILVNSPQLGEGIKEVKAYIKDQKPKWVVTLGAKPLEYLLGKKGKKNGVENWRGSVIEQDGIRYYCSLHPASVLYVGTQYPIISFDFRRLGRYINSGYQFPKHDFLLDPEGLELEEALREIESHSRITCDLEGKRSSFHIFCAGFGLSDTRAICIANHSMDLDPIFENSIRRILENPKIEKVFQNGFGYDILMLEKNGINVENYSFDTMIGAHVLDPEMPYGLDFLTSIYTDEPYYKNMVHGADDEEKSFKEIKDYNLFYTYNCIDCITTFQVSTKQHAELVSRRLCECYNYKHSLIPLGIHLTNSGMERDEGRKKLIRHMVSKEQSVMQQVLDMLAGFHVNVKSPIHMRKLFLEKFKFPERRLQGSITFNEDAIVSYIGVAQGKLDELRTDKAREEWEIKLVACKCTLLIRGHRQIKSNYIDIDTCEDGRMRSVYNLSAATETGRGSSHKYIDGSGLNAQTWPRERLEITEADYQSILEKINK